MSKEESGMISEQHDAFQVEVDRRGERGTINLGSL